MLKYTLIGVCIFLFSCQENSNSRQEFSLQSKNDSLNYVVLNSDTLQDRWELSYPVYQFQIGDIDENGTDDCLVGVIKTTHFDSVLAKRLFIFKNYKGYVRPLWLGSKLGQPLVDFVFKNRFEGARIWSIEKEKSGKYLVAEYKWKKFGVAFVQYLDRELSIDQAKNRLND